MLSTRYNVGSLLAAGADKMCLSIAAQILAAAALFSAANIVSMLMCVLEAQVRSVLKESAYCRMSSL